MGSPFLPIPMSFADAVWLAEGAGHIHPKQFSEKLVFQKTCASTSKHSSPSYLFFFNLREVSLSPTVKEPLVNSCLGAQTLLILACTIMQMQLWCSHTLGRDPIPASHHIQQLPTAPALPPLKIGSLTSAFVPPSVLTWVLLASVAGCTCCRPVFESLSAPVFKCSKTSIAENTQHQLLHLREMAKVRF